MSNTAAAKRAQRARLRGPEAPTLVHPRTGKPRTWSTATLPLGTIRHRPMQSGTLVAHIKVAMDGPKNRRWCSYARWWWEQNQGPIPDGKVVIHLDGDSSNDAPENLAIGTTDDALFIAHAKDPTLRESALRKQRVAEFNIARARIRRLQETVPGWYLVDTERRRVWNTGDNTRWDALERLGIIIPDDHRANGRGVVAALLGWPGTWTLEAAVLAVLADAACPLTRRQVEESAVELLAHYEHPAPRSPGTWSSTVSRLIRRGMVERESSSQRSALRIAESARAARGRQSKLLVVHSRDLGRYAGWERVSERGQEYQREAAGGGGPALLAELASVSA